MSDKTTLNGLPVITTEHCPEFRPALFMSNCGCSDHVRDDFNAFLLARFGKRRNVFSAAGALVMHPRTLQHIRQLIARRNPLILEREAA